MAVDEAKRRWWVIRSNRGQEKLAAVSLRADHVEAYLPLIHRETRKGLIGVPMFPGYLFVSVPPVSELWRLVFTARGVHSALTWGGRLHPLADQVIDAIQDRERAGFVRMAYEAPAIHSFRNGQLVTFKSGPFAGLPAVFQEPLDERRCVILIQLLADSARVAKAEFKALQALDPREGECGGF